MASDGTIFNGRSAHSLLDDAANGSAVFVGKPTLQRLGDVVGDAADAVRRARETVARIEREIDH